MNPGTRREEDRAGDAADPGDWVTRVNLIRSGDPLPDDVLARYARDPEPRVRLHLAWSNRVLPDETVTLLATDPVDQVRVYLTRSRRTMPLPAARILAAAGFTFRALLAQGPGGLPDPVLADLAADPDSRVRVRLAESSRPLPDSVTIRLAADDEADVRRALIRSPRPLPAAALMRLAESSDERSRALLAGAPRSLPVDVLVRLACLGGARVDDALIAAPDALPEVVVRAIIARKDPWATVALLRSLHPVPHDVLVECAASPNREIADEAASRAGLPSRGSWRTVIRAGNASPLQRAVVAAAARSTAVIVLAARDADPGVRAAAARNPSAGGDVLTRLASDPDQRVRSAVQARLVAAVTA